jgi:hypothetical protein
MSWVAGFPTAPESPLVRTDAGMGGDEELLRVHQSSDRAPGRWGRKKRRQLLSIWSWLERLTGVPAGTSPEENAVKYLCHLYYNTKKFDALTKDALQTIVAECQPHDAALRKTGQVSAIGRLAHGTAVTLRAQGGRTTTTEGGRNGGDDQIGAFMIVEARDLNEAVRIASLHPAANTGEQLGWAVEVRPIQAFEQPS